MKTKIETPNAPSAKAFLSQAIVSNSFVFVAGQVHSTPDGQIIVGTVAEKVKQIRANIEAILKAADLDLNSVVKVTIYVTDMSQMKELNEVYPTYFSEPYPAREAVCVKELPLGATIEISVTASK